MIKLKGTSTIKLTTAQALIRFLVSQYVSRDGLEHRFFKGCLGIFGHGNVAGIGQALTEEPMMPYTAFRNEQSTVHMATAHARATLRLSTYVCTSSIGPGATNMITGAALASINRLPVLLLPGDYIASGSSGTILQQWKSRTNGSLSVNDSFQAVSQYWDRIMRPEQLIEAMMTTMQVLTSPSDTGAATLCLPQDVQVEAFDYPRSLFEKRVWKIPRPTADKALIKQASAWLKIAKRPLVIAGGGVKYSEAQKELHQFIENYNIPVSETMSGMGSVDHFNKLYLGGIGVTGTAVANSIAQQADLVIAIGTRMTDFTSASYTLFQNENVRFISININERDSHLMNGLSLCGDARSTLTELNQMCYPMDRTDYLEELVRLKKNWEDRKNLHIDHKLQTYSQTGIISTLNDHVRTDDIVINASGSIPGELHQLWRPTSTSNLYIEYGYSCMGHEIPAGIGARLSARYSNVYVLIGDGSYLMIPQEITTAVQLKLNMTIILLDNDGYGSIGQLSEKVGAHRLGTNHENISGESLKIDYVNNAQSLGAQAVEAKNYREFERALKAADTLGGVHLIYCRVPKSEMLANNAWWDVPVAAVGQNELIKDLKEEYDQMKKKQKRYL